MFLRNQDQQNQNQQNAPIANDFYAKIIEKEMQLYKVNPSECPKHLELLFKALKTIMPIASSRSLSRHLLVSPQLHTIRVIQNLCKQNFEHF